MFAIGFSLGANILASVLGEISGDEGSHHGLKIDGACVVQAPIRFKIAMKGIHNSMDGFYNRKLGEAVKNLLLRHEPILGEEYKKKTGYDMKETLKSLTKEETTCKKIDELFIAKANGFKDADDYYQQSSSYDRIPKIEVPTLFYFAKDDPINSAECIDYDVFKQNKNVAMATTKHGGHLGYMESLNDKRMWVIDPCVKFF